MNEFMAQQGWQCPICKRVYSPFTIMCYYCGGESKTSTSTNVNSTGYIDWQKHQSITTADSTSISTGYATYTAEDKRTCDNCKHIAGLPSHNGTNEYSGKCVGCIDKCNWEHKE